MDNNSKKSNEKKEDKTEQADFETAISATGYGLFNICLLVVGLPCCIATVFETSTMSYILPSAECDLKLSLLDKGALNAVTYAGMITSAIFWGYMADTLGRKKLLVIGYILDGICDVLCALSNNLYMLMVFKYLGGFLICGPFAVLMSYLTEFHGTKHRGRVMMIIGMFFSLATLSLPGIAWGILPQDVEWTLIDNKIVIHSWNVFLFVCSLPSILSGFVMMLFPESPKFLMSQGKNEEAMKVFQTIFMINTRNSKDQYPIKSLVMEPITKLPTVSEVVEIHPDPEVAMPKRHSVSVSFREGIFQLKPLFQKPYLGHSIHVYTVQFGTLLGVNTIRLWLPQLFTMLAAFESDQGLMDSTGDAHLCSIISFNVNKSKIAFEKEEICEVNISETMYMNTMIVGLTALCGYFVASALINALGNKRIIIIALAMSGTSGFIMYTATNSLTTLILSAIYVSVGSLGSTALIGIIVNLFPTTLRTMVVSLAMMFGRLGALLGNVLFPVLMSTGCLPPFLMVGSVMLISSFLCIFLPVTHKSALK